MKTTRTLLTVLALSCAAILPARADYFFDTDYPEETFTFGARVGLNTSVSTVNGDLYNIYSHTSWGMGFDAGIVANINVRNYLSIQPGLFFQSRSSDFTHISSSLGETATWCMDVGHTLRYSFDIPIMAAFHFNLADNVRWNVEAGPYFSFNLKTNYDNTYFDTADSHSIDLRHKSVDVGFKFGTGFNIYDHYVVAVHYMAGFNDAWKDSHRGGHNKAWTFTIGYDF